MTFKAFFIRALALSLGIVAFMAAFNFLMNEYGLFGDAKGKSITIYGDERTAKYLLSMNYIPANFDGLLIGSSVSDNIDTKKLAGGRIYNGSINGATVAELKIIVNNVLARGDLKFVIISLYPILTETGEKRSSRMAPREYWGTFGSINIMDFYRSKLLVRYGKKHDYFNEYGRYNYNLRKEHGNSLKLIREKTAEIEPGKPITVNDRACEDLDALLKTLRAKGIRIFAYYHPIPQEWFSLYEKSYREYQGKMNALLLPSDTVWDYNTAEFLDFRKDASNYCDDVHLSMKGIDTITKHINTKILPSGIPQPRAGS